MWLASEISVKAAELRLSGLTVKQIAKNLGYSSLPWVRALIKRGARYSGLGYGMHSYPDNGRDR